VKDLLDALGPDFSAEYGNTASGQRLAFIWNNTRVTLTHFGELKGIARGPAPGTSAKTFPRIPITAYVRSKSANGVDFRILTVHLYWGSDEARYQEAKTLNDWLDGYLTSGHDKDVVLIGDCNTKPMGSGETHDSQTINNLEDGGVFTCVSKDHHEYTTPDSEERYDHAFLSQDLLNGEYHKGSWDVRREVVDTFLVEFKRDISNHVPVTVRLSDKDNDTEPEGDYGESSK
jgi:endonuclease/exonuclease/phosphatase family metal-dependent hydrolase